MTNKERYKREIKDLRDLLNDNEYTRTLPAGYHQFLSEMHRKLVSDFKITPKMLDSIQTAAATYRTYGDPDIKRKREAMLSKITKLKYLLTKCGYTRQYEYEKMEFLFQVILMQYEK